jgi:hypothetical protein
MIHLGGEKAGADTTKQRLKYWSGDYRVKRGPITNLLTACEPTQRVYEDVMHVAV